MSATPRRIVCAPSPIAWADEAHADTVPMHGPLACRKIAAMPAAMFGKDIGAKNGPIRRGPWENSVSAPCSIVSRAPIPVPMRTPTRYGSTSAVASPPSSRAARAAATPSCACRSMRRASFRPRIASASKPRTSPANRVSYSEASKRVMPAIPDLPAMIAGQISAIEFPTGQSAPIPVMTTLRRTSIYCSSLPGAIIRRLILPRGRACIRALAHARLKAK
jgi:hypothetical protein